MLEVTFVKEISFGDWKLSSIDLENWNVSHSMLRFHTNDSNYAEDTDGKNYYVRVPYSNIISMVEEA